MPKKYLPLIPFVIIGCLMIVVGLWYFAKLKTAPPPVAPEIAQPKITVPTTPSYYIDVTPVLSRTANGAQIEIWLDPKDAPVEVSTLSLHLIVNNKSGYLLSTTATPAISDTFKNDSWSFPFATLTPQGDNQVELKLTALYMSTSAYRLAEKVLIATIPVRTESGNDALSLTYGTDNNKAYTPDTKLIAYNQAGKTLDL